MGDGRQVNRTRKQSKSKKKKTQMMEARVCFDSDSLVKKSPRSAKQRTKHWRHKNEREGAELGKTARCGVPLTDQYDETVIDLSELHSSEEDRYSEDGEEGPETYRVGQQDKGKGGLVRGPNHRRPSYRSQRTDR